MLLLAVCDSFHVQVKDPRDSVRESKEIRSFWQKSKVSEGLIRPPVSPDTSHVRSKTLDDKENQGADMATDVT